MPEGPSKNPGGSSQESTAAHDGQYPVPSSHPRADREKIGDLMGLNGKLMVSHLTGQGVPAPEQNPFFADNGKPAPFGTDPFKLF